MTQTRTYLDRALWAWRDPRRRIELTAVACDWQEGNGI